MTLGITPEQEAALAASCNWWWREIPKGKPTDIVASVFKDGWALSAYIYEMGLRVRGRYEFGVPYCNLKKKQIFTLAARWPMKQTETLSVALPGINHEPGWTEYRNMSWNLHTPDKALADELLWFIRSERKAQGIPTPRRNEGMRRREIPWRVIELIDLQKKRIRTLTDSERSQVSKAKRWCKRVYKTRNVIRLDFKQGE